MNNCGISRWDDPNEINARLKALTSQPIWEVTDEYYNNVILNYFDEKCKASKAVYEESKEYIPGGVQHNLAFNKPFPMCMARADGAYLYDKDGNQYIDFLQAGGPTILGSNYPVIREKVIELLNECGPVTGLLHESELMIAKEINRHMPNVEMFRARQRHGVRHGGASHRAHCHGQKAHHQGRRRVPRLVRPDGLRSENPRQPGASGISRHSRRLL